jgi:HemY protein
MKRSFLVLIAIALALLAAALAPLFKSDPGLVKIHFQGWTVETSVLVLILAALAVWLVVHLIIKLWKMPGETARKIREQRALVQLEKGLLALSEGDWVKAERALQKSADSHGRTTARYLAAAEAADGQDAGDRADYYLDQADTRNRRQRFLVELTRARILTQNRQFSNAIPILEALHKTRRKHAQVLELLATCYDETGQWEALQKILPVMQKAGVVDAQRVEQLQQHAAISELKQYRSADALKAGWRGLPKPMQRVPEVVRAFADQTLAIEAPELNEEVLRSSLKKQWNPALLIPYGESGGDDLAIRLKQCEAWLKDHPDEPLLHLVLGRLCAREELWGKARHHMIRSLELEPTVGGYDSLGQLLERKGELEIAMLCFRNALRMNQGKEPLPLPSYHAQLTSSESPPAAAAGEA